MIQTVNVNVAAQPTSGGPESFLVLSQNENGRQIRFRVLGDDLPAGCTATFSGTKPDGTVYSASGTIDGNFVLLDEEIQMTAVSGRWDAKLSIAKGTENIMTSLIRVTVVADAVSGDAIPSSSELDGIVAECRSYAEAAKNEAYGSPLTASTAAAMTDTGRVYVYTGSEPGMTAGHWYYYNGTAWADGGVYNAVAVDTDTTLSIAGKAADAKEVGDQITDLKEDLSYKVNSTTIYCDDVEDGYYSSNNGQKLPNTSSSSYKRSVNLIPADEDSLYIANRNTLCCCYEKDGTFISRITLYPKTGTYIRQTTPVGTAYVGLSATNATDFQLVIKHYNISILTTRKRSLTTLNTHNMSWRICYHLNSILQRNIGLLNHGADKTVSSSTRACQSTRTCKFTNAILDVNT